MNANALAQTPESTAGSRVGGEGFDHLDYLESEAVFILRETAGECENPALLFSGGKDSIILLRLAEKAFRPDRFPFPLLHIDTGHNFPEVIEFRDRRAHELGERLIVRKVQESIDKGRVTLKHPKQSRNEFQTVTLLDAIEEFGFDACIGGARRDEEKARAKERIFSVRDEFGQWNPKAQRPGLWDLYNPRVHQGENVRIFPLSNWTETDVWQYIARENLTLPHIYYAHERLVVRRSGKFLAHSGLIDLGEEDRIEKRMVRFRTVGDMSCTMAVESSARTNEEIIAELLTSEYSERGASRLDDRTSEASMELRKKRGYF